MGWCEAYLQMAKVVYFERIREEPSFIGIQLILFNQSEIRNLGNFCIYQKIQNQIIKIRDHLIAAINHPSENYFNCSVFEPHLGIINDTLQGWHFHAEILNKGRIVPINSFDESQAQRHILFFKKKTFLDS